MTDALAAFIQGAFFAVFLIFYVPLLLIGTALVVAGDLVCVALGAARGGK